MIFHLKKWTKNYENRKNSREERFSYCWPKTCTNMLYPIGIQSFEHIRSNGYVYVDKTDLVYKLASTGKYYFLSRPRRFGKSLLVSTLEAYFSGKKELFEGLSIADWEKDWIEYPVLRFDLTGQSYSDPGSLDDTLNTRLFTQEKNTVLKRKPFPQHLDFGFS